MAERLEVAHDLLRGVGKGIHDAHKQARMEGLHENFWQKIWSTWHHFNSFHKFPQDISALHQKALPCSLACGGPNDSCFTAQVDVAQGRIHGDKPSVLPNLPSSMQALQTLISNLGCTWRWFVGSLRFCLPDGLAAFRFWKRCVQAPLLYADEQSEQSRASAKIIALPQERSQKAREEDEWRQSVSAVSRAKVPINIPPPGMFKVRCAFCCLEG